MGRRTLHKGTFSLSRLEFLFREVGIEIEPRGNGKHPHLVIGNVRIRWFNRHDDPIDHIRLNRKLSEIRRLALFDTDCILALVPRRHPRYPR